MNRAQLIASIRSMPAYRNKTDAEWAECEAGFGESLDRFGLDADSDIDPLEMAALTPHVLEGLLEEARAVGEGTVEFAMLEFAVRLFQNLAADASTGDPDALAQVEALSQGILGVDR